MGPLTYKREKYIKRGKNTSPFSKFFPLKGQENDPESPFAGVWRCFHVPKIVQSDCGPSFTFTWSVSRPPSPCSNRLPGFLCRSKRKRIPFSASPCSSHHLKDQNFILPYRTRYTSSRELLQPNVLSQTQSARPVVRFPPPSQTTQHQNQRKLLKYCIFFLKDFFKRCQDICTYLPVPCFSVYETRKHVQTPTIHNAGMSLRVC